MSIAAQDKAIAQTIINQMGGGRRLQMMVGVTTFVALPSSSDQLGGLAFQFKGSRKANYLEVILCPDDTYTLKFCRYGLKQKQSIVKEFESVYCDQLIETFENFTGLYLSL